MFRKLFPVVFVFALAVSAIGQSSPAVVGSSDLKKVTPDSYFFRGLSATVQARNTAAVKFDDGFFVIAGLVDTSGYSSDIKAKYAGLFITEKKLSFGGKTLVPGEYGFGYTADGQFHILDVAASELLTAPLTQDDKVVHAVPLKITVDGQQIRLYLGKKYVTFSAQ